MPRQGEATIEVVAPIVTEKPDMVVKHDIVVHVNGKGVFIDFIDPTMSAKFIELVKEAGGADGIKFGDLNTLQVSVVDVSLTETKGIREMPL